MVYMYNNRTLYCHTFKHLCCCVAHDPQLHQAISEDDSHDRSLLPKRFNIIRKWGGRVFQEDSTARMQKDQI